MEGRSFELECFQLGAVDYLQKPVNPDLMRIKVRRHIETVVIKRENQRLKKKLLEIQQQVNQLFDAALQTKN